MESIVSLKSIGSGVEAEITVSKGAEGVAALTSFICAESNRAEADAHLGLDRLSEINADVNRLTCNAELNDYSLSAMCGVLAGRLNSIINKTRKLRYGNVKNEKSGKTEISDSLSALLGDKKGGAEEAELSDSKKAHLEDKKSDIDGCDNRNADFVGRDTGIDATPLVCDGNEETEFIFSEELFSGLAEECGEEIPENKKRLSSSKSLLGLVFSVAEQFSNNPDFTCESSGLAVEINSKGNFVSREKNGKIFSGIINWFFNVAEDMSRGEKQVNIGAEGSRALATLLTLAYELSRLSVFKDGALRERLYDSFCSFVSKKESEKLRADLKDIFCKESKGGVFKNQQSAIIFNELLVRAVFFVRRFISEMKEKYSLSLVSYSALIPYRDRTLSRMLSVSFGVFTAVDITRAALKSAAKGGVFSLEKFLFDTLLKVNIVGVGRFALELKDDVALLKEREELRRERLRLCGEVLAEYGTAVFYKQAGMWVSAEDTVKTLSEVSLIAERAVAFYTKAVSEMTEELKAAEERLQGLKGFDGGLFSELSDILKYE